MATSVRIRRHPARRGGRVVDTAGDGAFSVSPRRGGVQRHDRAATPRSPPTTSPPARAPAGGCASASTGATSTDSVVVTGDAVNLSSRVASSSRPGEIRITRQVYPSCRGAMRIRCKPLRPSSSGIEHKVIPMELIWWDPSRFPECVRIENSGEQLQRRPGHDQLWPRQRARWGQSQRHRHQSSRKSDSTTWVSRWHFELRRRPDGFVPPLGIVPAHRVDGRILQKAKKRRSASARASCWPRPS